MLRVWLLLALTVGCAHDEPGPPPWTSGTLTRAQVWTSTGFSTLAGRIVPTTGFACDYTPNDGAFYFCPQDADPIIGYSDAACTMPIWGYGERQPTFVRFNKLFYQVQAGSQISAYDTHCEPTTLQGGLQIIRSVSAAEMDLGTSFYYEEYGVRFHTYETSSGFTAITSIDPPVTYSNDTTSARLRTVYEASGSVKRPVGIYDSVLDHVCAPVGGYCLPLPDAINVLGGSYDDPTCSTLRSTQYSDQAGYGPGGWLVCDQPNTDSPYWSKVLVETPPGHQWECLMQPVPPYRCRQLALSEVEPIALSIE